MYIKCCSNVIRSLSIFNLMFFIDFFSFSNFVHFCSHFSSFDGLVLVSKTLFCDSVYVDAKSCGVESLTQIYIKRWLGSFMNWRVFSIAVTKKLCYKSKLTLGPDTKTRHSDKCCFHLSVGVVKQLNRAYPLFSCYIWFSLWGLRQMITLPLHFQLLLYIMRVFLHTGTFLGIFMKT